MKFHLSIDIPDRPGHMHGNVFVSHGITENELSEFAKSRGQAAIIYPPYGDDKSYTARLTDGTPGEIIWASGIPRPLG